MLGEDGNKMSKSLRNYREPNEIFDKITDDAAGVWVDNAMIDERAEHQSAPEKIVDARTRSGWQGLYFGGVAFKLVLLEQTIASVPALLLT